MVEVPLQNGGAALIDAEDAARVTPYKWYWLLSVGGARYAIRCDGVDTLRAMHRLVLNANSGQFVDHRDRNGLNNQKANLRFCTRSQNAANSVTQGDSVSGFKGVAWSPRGKGWYARITVDGRRHHLGFFPTLEQAVRAYNDAACLHFGEFARPNRLPSSGRFEDLIQALGLEKTEAGILRLHLDEGLPRHEVAQRLGLRLGEFATAWERLEARVAEYQESLRIVPDEDREIAELMSRPYLRRQPPLSIP